MSAGGAVVRLTRRCAGLCKCCGEIKDLQSQLTEARERLRVVTSGIEQYLEDNDGDCGCGGEDGAEDYSGSVCALHEALIEIQEPNGKKGG